MSIFGRRISRSLGNRFFLLSAVDFTEDFQPANDLSIFISGDISAASLFPLKRGLLELLQMQALSEQTVSERHVSHRSSIIAAVFSAAVLFSPNGIFLLAVEPSQPRVPLEITLGGFVSPRYVPPAEDP